MLRIELACQEFARSAGNEGKTSWIVAINEDQLEELMSISNGIFAANTRKWDQLDGTDVWTIRGLLMLITILKSWRRCKPWVSKLLDCFESDEKLLLDWELRVVWNDGGQENWAKLLPGELPDKEELRRTLLAGYDQRSSKGIKDFTGSEIDMLINNLGEEDQLW